MPSKTTRIKATEVISFRITQDTHKLLERYARTQFDELGQQLSPDLAARRLLQAALKEEVSNAESQQNLNG